MAAPQASALLRWGQLVVGVICMVMIANLQYGWTFFVPGIQKSFGWDRASIQVAFTLFVLFETWLVPIEGWFVDKYGPGFVIFVGGILCGIGWVMNSYATTLTAFYAAQMTAMDTATRNSAEMIGSLTLYMNKVRQAAITREIIEVVSGAQAL